MKRDPPPRAPLGLALADRCASPWRDRLGEAERAELARIVRTAFVDTAACVLAGRAEDVTQRVGRWAGLDLPADRARLPSVAGRDALAPALAALVNATAGHALDFDDVGLAGHPSVVLVPALLAEHDARGTHGWALIEAYAKGYAVWADLQRRMKIHLHGRGWHPTAVFGTVAAAAAVAAARGLPPAQTAHALGIAASCAAGLIANFGSMTKPLQVGRAVRAGLEAVELAQAGVDASADALDGPKGLLSALAGPDQADLQSPVIDDFETCTLRLRPGIKKYPVCYAAHRVIDGVLDLAAAHGVRADAVERVDATLSATTAGVLRHHAPTTLAEARFSLEFVVAVALARGAVGLRDVTPERLADAQVRALMPRVFTHTTDTRCPLEPSFAFEDRVTLTLTDARVLDSGPIRFARGHAQLPLDDAQVHAKLFACVEDGEEALARGVLARIDAALAD